MMVTGSRQVFFLTETNSLLIATAIVKFHLFVLPRAIVLSCDTRMPVSASQSLISGAEPISQGAEAASLFGFDAWTTIDFAR